MRAIALRRFGGPEVLEVVELPRPAPGPGEVLVTVAAAGLNGGEVKVRAGLFPGLGPPPIVLGSDFSGVVAEVGAGVTHVRPGDEVYGMLYLGTYAEQIAVPAENLALKPPSLDHVHAAALPVAALTAWQGVVELADVQPGQRVLIHAAGGGVGHVAVQLAKWRGAHVIATARSAKHAFLRELGVDEPVDYTTTDFTLAARDVDVVIDLVGGSYGLRSLASLRPGGLLLSAAADPGLTPADAEARGRRYARISLRPSSAILERIAELVESGQLRVNVERTFRFDEAPAAHTLSEAGHVTGKLVLVP